MSQIRVFETITVALPNGSSIEVIESFDGTYNVKNNDYHGQSIRVGVKDENGIEYRYWKDINKRENEIRER